MQQCPWFATYGEYGISAQIEPSRLPSVTALLEDAMRRHADLPASRSFGQTMTVAEVDRHARDFAA